MATTELFGIPLYIGFDSNSDISNLISSVVAMTTQPSAIVSNDGGWQSSSKNLNLIDSIIQQHTKKYFRSLGNSNVNFTIVSQWANVNPIGTANMFHSHGNSDFSGVFYLQAEQRSGNLILHNLTVPSNNLTQHFKLARNLTTGHAVTPEPGMIVLFPGNLPHSVLVNNSKKDRISIAFNIDIAK